MPLDFTAGTTLVPSEMRTRWASCDVRKEMWNGVVKVTRFPLTDAISIACPIGREAAAGPARPSPHPW